MPSAGAGLSRPVAIADLASDSECTRYATPLDRQALQVEAWTDTGDLGEEVIRAAERGRGAGQGLDTEAVTAADLDDRLKSDFNAFCLDQVHRCSTKLILPALLVEIVNNQFAQHRHKANVASSKCRVGSVGDANRCSVASPSGMPKRYSRECTNANHLSSR